MSVLIATPPVLPDPRTASARRSADSHRAEPPADPLALRRWPLLDRRHGDLIVGEPGRDAQRCRQRPRGGEDAPRPDRPVLGSHNVDDASAGITSPIPYPWVKGMLRPLPEVGSRVRCSPRGSAMRFWMA